MMPCEKGKYPYSFVILLTQSHEFPTPKLTNSHIFVISLPFERDIIFKESLYDSTYYKKL